VSDEIVVERTPEDMADLDFVFAGDKYVIGRFFQRIARLASGPSRLTIFHNSLLAMSIGGFEALVAGVVAQFLGGRPIV
jgi:hypothetical protein